MPSRSQFLRELHFIEAASFSLPRRGWSGRSSFGNCTSLRLVLTGRPPDQVRRRSSFGNCTSLRRVLDRQVVTRVHVAVPSGTALH